MLKKLRESGLAEYVKQLGFAEVPSTQVAKKWPTLPYKVKLIHIPYFTIGGKRSDFFRVRYLEDTRTLMERKTTKKAVRYAQLPGSVNELYLPPVLDWQKIASDVEEEVIITEGEFKAGCGCVNGFNVVGLGGVWCWRSAKENIDLLPQFKEFKWQGRRVYVIFDSDAASNPKVIQAENALATMLTRCGAKVTIVRLPPTDDGRKQGLDDFIVAGENLEMLVENSVEFSEAKDLHKMNEEVLYVQDPGLILRLDNLQRLSPDAFTRHAYSTRTYTVRVETKDGFKLSTKYTAVEWVKWPGRCEVRRLTYSPGKDRVTDDGELNLWPGWAVEPEKGDVTPWTNLLKFLFKDEPDAVSRTWVERWLAYPLQYPGTKLGTSVVLWGSVHGTGKSAIGYTMKQIYGKNATEIADRDLGANHNEWAENKQFVMGDEITGGDKRQSADRMKSMITQRELRLNPKYIPSYTVPDVINYYFTSNHPDAFFLEDTDRRYFIHEVRGVPMDPKFYTEYFTWLASGGAKALFHHLLTLPLEDWNPMGHAPMTRSKRMMIADTQSDLGGWIRDFVMDPAETLTRYPNLVGRKLLTSEEIRQMYDPEFKTKVTGNGVSRELTRAGALRANFGNPLRTVLGHVRLWATDMKTAELDPERLAKLYITERKTSGRKY